MLEDTKGIAHMDWFSLRNSALLLKGILVLLVACKEEEASPLDCSGLTLEIQSIQDVSNCGLKDGQVTVLASGSNEPYEYKLNSATSNSGTFGFLSAGDYTIMVTDATKSCSKTLEFSVATQGSDFAASAASVASTQCTPDSNGFITVTASNGVEPYTYRLGLGSFTTENVFPNLEFGKYVVQAKDAQDCIIEIGIEVPGIKYETIKSLIELNCATVNCHNGDLGAQSNYLIFENVKENSTGIRARTSDKTMPPSGNLSQEQIDIIACWVAEGANN